MAECTPMMQQYLKTKAEHPDCILFFRLGDFYEMFQEDAKLVSEELDLTLTTRDRNKPEEERTPMCGVPYHSADAYIARLIEKGYKVAICEQMEDPTTAKGLVEREVVRIITPRDGHRRDDARRGEKQLYLRHLPRGGGDRALPMRYLHRRGAGDGLFRRLRGGAAL